MNRSPQVKTPRTAVRRRPAMPDGAQTLADVIAASAPSPSPRSWPGAVAPEAMALTFVARVVSGNAVNGYVLDAGAQPGHAHRAASCLIEPCVGDRVACWRVAEDGEGEGSAFIVAVLTRAEMSAPARLSVAGDLEIAPLAGRLRLHSEQAVTVDAPRCEVAVDTLQVQAQSTSFVSRVIETIGETCTATIGQLRLVGGLFSTVFDRETHHANSHRRQVEGIDRLDAHVVDHHARDVMQLQAENVLANGNRLVKVQGAQIHFG